MVLLAAMNAGLSHSPRAAWPHALIPTGQSRGSAAQGRVTPILQRDLMGSRPGCHAGSLAASSSTFSILGGELSKVAALAIKAAAIWPFRCAWRPASSAKASNTPNVEGPNFNANQAVVPDSALASGSALARKSASAASWPGLASANKQGELGHAVFLWVNGKVGEGIDETAV